MNKGKIVQIIGSVVDVEFQEEAGLPEIFNALKVHPVNSASHGEAVSAKSGQFNRSSGPQGEVTLEVVKHLDTEKVRAISLQSTDGLERGLACPCKNSDSCRRPCLILSLLFWARKRASWVAPF